MGPVHVAVTHLQERRKILGYYWLKEYGHVSDHIKINNNAGSSVITLETTVGLLNVRHILPRTL